MPLNPPVLSAGFVAPCMVATGNLGIGLPKLALGVSIGVCQYLALAKVSTVDVGTLGAGTSLFPLIVPFPLLQSNLLASFAASNLIGVMAPSFLSGMATGLTTGLISLALMQTNHPTVGVGAGVARIVGPTSVPSMVSGFAAAGMTGSGPTTVASAIGRGLDMTFASFFQVGVPIVGTPSPIGSSGVGFGTVI